MGLKRGLQYPKSGSRLEKLTPFMGSLQMSVTPRYDHWKKVQA